MAVRENKVHIYCNYASYPNKESSSSSSCIDNITAELLRADVEFSTERIHGLRRKVWSQETISEDWKKGVIIKLPKKGNLKDCKNSRRITLLSIVGKIL